MISVDVDVLFDVYLGIFGKRLRLRFISLGLGFIGWTIGFIKGRVMVLTRILKVLRRYPRVHGLLKGFDGFLGLGLNSDWSSTWGSGFRGDRRPKMVAGEEMVKKSKRIKIWVERVWEWEKRREKNIRGKWEGAEGNWG